MRRLNKFKIDLIILAGFLFLPFLLFGEVSLGNRTMLPVDNLFQWAPWSSAADQFGVEIPQNNLLTDLIVENYAWKRFILHSIENKKIPLWNPYLFAGTPFLANGQHSAYYPFSIFFLVVPLEKAYGWYTVSQLWLAGVCMYFFGRILKMRRSSATLAGLIYQGCGMIVVSAAVFPMILGAVVWLPLLLACVEKVITSSTQTPRSKSNTTLLWLVLGAIVLGIQILAGHIEITYYTLLIMTIYAAWRLSALLVQNRWFRQVLRPSGWLLSMVALGIMVGAVQLIPFYEVGQVNFREGSVSFDEVRSWAFPNRRILTLVVPNFFGNPAHHSYVDALNGNIVPLTTNYYGEANPRGKNSSDWGIKNYVEGGVYLAILPLFLALIGAYSFAKRSFVETRRSHIGFFSILSFFSLAFIFGTPLYAILYYGLPFINQLHTPFRWVFPLSLCVAVLSGFGADFLAETRTWRRYKDWQALRQSQERIDQSLVWASDKGTPNLLRPFVLWGTPSIITVLAGFAFWSGLVFLAGLIGSKLFYSNLESIIERLFLGLAQAADAFPNTRAFYSYEYRQLFLFGLMLVAAGSVLRVSRCPIFLGKIPAWLFMAAITIGLDLFLANVGFNAAVDPALLEYKPEMVQWLEQQPGHWRLTSFNPHGDKPFNANSGWLFDFQDIRGYDSIISKQYTQYIATIEPQNELLFNRIQPLANWESLNSPLLDVLGVKYIITAATIDLPKLSLAWEGEGLRIYENLAVAPRAYTLPQTSMAVVDDALAALTEYDPRQYVVIETTDLPLEISSFNFASPAPANYQTAEVDSYQEIEVITTAEVSQPSWLILNDSYFSGWKAYIRPAGGDENDEVEVDIIKVNGNFRGIQLEAGHWTARFRYSPRSFQLGGLASFMGGIILLFVAGIWGWQRFVNPDTAMTNTRSIAKNSITPVILNLFNRAIDFVFAAFYLRFLGPADAGSYATAIAVAGIFEIISNYGLDLLLMREVSQDKSRASHFLLNSTILRLGAAVVASLPVAVFLFGTNFSNNPASNAEITAIALIMVGMLFSGISKGVDRLFYVYEKAEIPAAMTTTTTILKVAFGVMALLLGFGFVGLAAVSILTNIITMLILTILALRNFNLSGPWQVDWTLQRQMVHLGFPLMLIHLLQTIFISIDVFLLRFMLDNGEEVVGWYNSAYKWFNALQIVPSFFTLALFPIISREIQNSLESARRMYQMAIKLMMLLAFPVAAITSFTAYPLVTVLAGNEFLPHGAIALQIVIWSIPIGWLNSVTNYVLIGLGLEKMQPRAFTIAVVFNILANLLFIPRYTYVAASVTTILSEVILLIIFDHYLRKRMPGINWLRFTARPLLVTIMMVLVMLLGFQIHMLVGLILGFVVYPVGLWLLRVFGEEERHILRSVLPSSIAARLRLI